MQQDQIKDTKAKKTGVLYLSAESFVDTIMNSPVPVLVDFWAPWCAPCRMLAPVIEEISEEMSGKISVAKLNIDENQNVAAHLNIQSIPTIVLFDKSKASIVAVGYQPKNQLIAAITEAMDAIQAKA